MAGVAEPGPVQVLGPMLGPVAVGPVVVDEARRAVCTRDGARVRLTSAEYGLLAALVRAGGTVVPVPALHGAAFGKPFPPGSRQVSQLVHELRRKLPPDEEGLPLIQTVRSAGFWIRAGSPAPCLERVD